MLPIRRTTNSNPHRTSGDDLPYENLSLFLDVTRDVSRGVDVSRDVSRRF